MVIEMEITLVRYLSSSPTSLLAASHRNSSPAPVHALLSGGFLIATVWTGTRDPEAPTAA